MMTTILWNFASFVIALGTLITIHEFGHFWVARRCGVRIEKFSIGFGRSIWSRQGRDGTEYSLSMIPLGGYVKMLDGRAGAVPDALKDQAFDQKKLWQRSAIVAAGPVFNFLFALIAYWLVMMIGVPAVKPVVGDVSVPSIAADAGLKSGMEIRSVDGMPTRDWESVNMALISHIGDAKLTMNVAESTDTSTESDIQLTFDLSQWNFDPEKESAMGALGFQPYRPAVTTTLNQVIAQGAGAQAGLKVGDQIVGIDGVEIDSWAQVVQSIQSHPETPLQVELRRHGNIQFITLLPQRKLGQDGEPIGYAGISPTIEAWPEQYRYERQYGLFAAIPQAFEKTGQVISVTFSIMKKLVTGDVSLNNLSGPISIAKGAGTTAEYGFVYFISFLALISINLGLINLVPLPVLDGGHLLFFAIEAVTRRPVPEKIQELGYRIGGAIIFSLMAIALFNDFMRL